MSQWFSLLLQFWGLPCPLPAQARCCCPPGGCKCARCECGGNNCPSWFFRGK